MNHGGKNFSIRNVIAGASMMAAMFAGAPVFAQPQAITVATVSTGDAAQKAQSIISKPGSYVLNKNIVNGKTSANIRRKDDISAPGHYHRDIIGPGDCTHPCRRR